MQDNALDTVSRAPLGNNERYALSRLLQGPARIARTALNDLVTTTFPSDCRVCGNPLLEAGRHPVCNACVSSPSEEAFATCARCGEVLEMESVRFGSQFHEGLLCSPCRLVPPPFERAIAYTAYRDEVREMIHLLKYEQMRTLAKPLGRYLSRSIEGLEPAIGAQLLIVAVPLFSAKERQRGYNQAILLADAAVAELKRTRPSWKVTSAHKVIRRVRETQSQFELTPRGRRHNLRGAFDIPHPNAVKDREILLVDDIYTTGATARACSAVLRRAGAKKIWVATVSRSQPEMVAQWNSQSTTKSTTAAWDAG